MAQVTKAAHCLVHPAGNPHIMGPWIKFSHHFIAVAPHTACGKKRCHGIIYGLLQNCEILFCTIRAAAGIKFSTAVFINDGFDPVRMGLAVRINKKDQVTFAVYKPVVSGRTRSLVCLSNVFYFKMCLLLPCFHQRFRSIR